jgi:hypothetical protein
MIGTQESFNRQTSAILKDYGEMDFNRPTASIRDRKVEYT